VDKPAIGDLIKTIYRNDYAVVTVVTKPTLRMRGFEWGAQYVYPSDGYRGSQPRKYIKEVINASR
jgi:hypothetical protein